MSIKIQNQIQMLEKLLTVDTDTANAIIIVYYARRQQHNKIYSNT